MNSGLSYQEVYSTVDDTEELKFGDRLYSYTSLMASQFPANQWAVRNLIPANGVTVLSSMPGSYKTWVLLHMALSIATGQKVFGEFDTYKPIKILMIDEENGPSLIQNRINSLKPAGYPKVDFLFDSNFKAHDKQVEMLIEYCDRHKVKMVMIDSLIRIHNANENDASEMSKVFSVLRRISSAGITVLMTHHNRKPGPMSQSTSHEMRGSSDILASLDCHISLNRKGKKLQFRQTKIRHCEEAKPFEVEVTNEFGKVNFIYKGNIEKQDTKQLLESKILQLLGDGPLTQTAIANNIRSADIRVGINKIRECLEGMIMKELIESSPGYGKSINYKLKK